MYEIWPEMALKGIHSPKSAIKAERSMCSSRRKKSMIKWSTSVTMLVLTQSWCANGADSATGLIPLDAKIPVSSSIDNRGLRIFEDKMQIKSGKVQYGYLINKSHMTLDCQGATLDGGGKIPTAVLIESNGKPLEDIIVKNCIFKNFKYNGIRVGWSIKDALKYSIHKGDLYQYHPSNILIQNVSVLDSGTVGVYVDDYVSNVRILNSEVLNSGYVGVYFEFSSKDNTIKDSLISHNGHGRLINGVRNNIRREGVSIDSSEGNVISGNVFSNNATGSIFLYKNCQEQVTKGGSVKRILGASSNIIKDNKFFNEKIGVWIASRQSRDLKNWDCGDSSIYQGRFFLDYADENTVQNNNFCNVEKGVIVEGDKNKVVENTFKGRFSEGVFQPITARQKYLNRPPVGNVYENNSVYKNIPCGSE